MAAPSILGNSGRIKVFFPAIMPTRCRVKGCKSHQIKGNNLSLFPFALEGWSEGAKVSYILRHRGVQLIMAYRWARPAILVAGKGRGGMFLFLLFLHFQSCSFFFPVPLFLLFYYLSYLFSAFLWETTQNDIRGLTCR